VLTPLTAGYHLTTNSRWQLLALTGHHWLPVVTLLASPTVCPTKWCWPSPAQWFLDPNPEILRYRASARTVLKAVSHSTYTVACSLSNNFSIVACVSFWLGHVFIEPLPSSDSFFLLHYLAFQVSCYNTFNSILDYLFLLRMKLF
jgi:hypothetical protein